MSKIYEALLRAEQERLAAQGKQGAAQPEKASTFASASELAGETPAQSLKESYAATAVLEHPATADAVLDHPVLEHTDQPVVVEENVLPAEGTPATSPLTSAFSASRVAGPHAVLDPTGFDWRAAHLSHWTPDMSKLPALEERGSSVEQFRSLRTRLSGFRENNKLKSIMVSSGLPREGKSFIAANLAVSFARHKAARVLLIDGDMRRSSLHTVLGCSRGPGLTEYLAGKSSLAEVLQRAAISEEGRHMPNGLASLTFIGGGDHGEVAADLSGSNRFRQLIQAASSYFDWIIVDSSPVNLVADGVNLASVCDGVLMVAREGVTKFEAAQRALNELKGARVLGVVLNAVKEAPNSGGYYGYDGYGSYDSPPTETAAQPTEGEPATT